MSDTIFGKILRKELPSAKVYEDAHTYAFLDLYPTTKGHTLVIPKSASEQFLVTEDEVITHLMHAAKHVGNLLKEKLGATGINIIINNGEDAGQVIFHTHVHIIPRYKNDGLKHWPPGYEYQEGEMNALSELLQK